MDEIKFVVDVNAGKLAHWLRIMGYDTLLFNGQDDGQMIKIAMEQDRIILTKDSQFLKRRVIKDGKIKAIHIKGESPKEQLKQVVKILKLDYHHKPFSICLECNYQLVQRNKEEIKDRVPPHVYKTRASYMECPSCHRIYWQGTHWESMISELEKFAVSKTVSREER